MIVLIGGEKGGTGKSTISINLAVLRAKAGKAVLLVDTDKQLTSTSWAEEREQNEITPAIQCIQKTGKGLTKQIEALAEHYDDIIIDAGGHDSVELRGAIAAADKIYIPIQASQFDLWTLESIEEIITLAKEMLNPDLKASVLINGAPTHAIQNEINEAKEYIESFDSDTLYLCPIVIKTRKAFRTAAMSGLSIVEVDNVDQKAVDEMNDLYNEVFSNDQ